KNAAAFLLVISSGLETSLVAFRIIISDSSTSLRMTNNSLLLNGCNRHGRDPFAAADRSKAFVCRGLDADTRFIYGNRLRDDRSHRWDVRSDFRRLSNDRCIDIRQ